MFHYTGKNSDPCPKCQSKAFCVGVSALLLLASQESPIALLQCECGQVVAVDLKFVGVLEVRRDMPRVMIPPPAPLPMKGSNGHG